STVGTTRWAPRSRMNRWPPAKNSWRGAAGRLASTAVERRSLPVTFAGGATKLAHKDMVALARPGNVRPCLLECSSPTLAGGRLGVVVAVSRLAASYRRFDCQRRSCTLEAGGLE